MYSVAMPAVSSGSSPMYSKFRPPTESRCMLTPGPRRMSTPSARHSSPMLLPNFPANSSFQVEANGNIPGNDVLLPSIVIVSNRTPCDASAIVTGRMPSLGIPGILNPFHPPVKHRFSSNVSRRIKSAARFADDNSSIGIWCGLDAVEGFNDRLESLQFHAFILVPR